MTKPPARPEGSFSSFGAGGFSLNHKQPGTDVPGRLPYCNTPFPNRLFSQRLSSRFYLAVIFKLAGVIKINVNNIIFFS